MQSQSRAQKEMSILFIHLAKKNLTICLSLLETVIDGPSDLDYIQTLPGLVRYCQPTSDESVTVDNLLASKTSLSASA